MKDIYSKIGEDGKHYLLELQSNGNLEWVKITTNTIGNKKKRSSHNGTT